MLSRFIKGYKRYKLFFFKKEKILLFCFNKALKVQKNDVLKRQNRSIIAKQNAAQNDFIVIIIIFINYCWKTKL